MLLREEMQREEMTRLSEYAAKSGETKGRKRSEPLCPLRTEFQRDRDRIIHSKSFRRLMHKTQVFISPEKDHFRTRLTHTVEVSQIARTIARALRLNEDLTEAIALSHDLGHTPFGHNGEFFLNQIHRGGFAHNIQSLRVVDVLEKNGIGMNLTEEVRDGILNHTGTKLPITLEGQIVKISDRIAYINHDIDDAVRAGVIDEEMLPKHCVEALGSSHSGRINTLVWDVIKNSDQKPLIKMSEPMKSQMEELRSFMFANVYHNPVVKKVEEMDKIENIISSLYKYYLQHPAELPKESQFMAETWGLEEVVKDHVAGMSDRYAVNDYKEIFVINL